jgi:hypothetical protein
MKGVPSMVLGTFFFARVESRMRTFIKASLSEYVMEGK